MSSRRLAMLVVAATGALIAVPRAAYADLNLGAEARAMAMAGAGLAILERGSVGLRDNPAALAFNKGFSAQWPDAGFGYHGASFDQAVNYLSSGKFSVSDALKIAADLGKHPSTVGVSFALPTVRFGHFDFQARLDPALTLSPGAGYRAWATSGQSLPLWLATKLTAADFGGGGGVRSVQSAVDNLDLSATLSGVAAASFAIGYGQLLPASLVDPRTIGQVSFGVRVRPVWYVQSAWRVTPDVTGVNSLATLGAATYKAAPMAIGKNGKGYRISGPNITADLAATWKIARFRNMTAALTVKNLVPPNFKLAAGLGLPDGGRQLVSPSVNIGWAWQPFKGVSFAADCLDLARSQGTQQLAVGAEYRPPLPLLNRCALRSGYSSLTGFTVGLGVGDFGIAYAAHQPVLLNAALGF